MERLAIVTGTSRGLGAAIARELVARGWTVWGVARGESPCDESEPRYTHVRHDLSRPKAFQTWLEDAFARDPDLADVRRVGLVNNAGVLQPVETLADTSMEDLSRALTINALVPSWTTGRVLRRFPDVPVRVVDVSSGAASNPYPGWGAYCASKAALEMLGRVHAVELEETTSLAGRDARIVSWSPGVVATDMQAEVRASDPDAFPRLPRFEALHAEGQLLDPEVPAAECADLLEADDLPPHSVRRFGA